MCMCMHGFDSNTIWLTLSNHEKVLILSLELMLAINKVLEDANITPIIHRLDNEISDNNIQVIKKKGLKHHIATSHDHSQLPVKGDISTWKPHFTSYLHGAEKASLPIMDL